MISPHLTSVRHTCFCDRHDLISLTRLPMRYTHLDCINCGSRHYALPNLASVMHPRGLALPVLTGLELTLIKLPVMSATNILSEGFKTKCSRLTSQRTSALNTVNSSLYNSNTVKGTGKDVEIQEPLTGNIEPNRIKQPLYKYLTVLQLDYYPHCLRGDTKGF